jgi:HD-GYP domain-containing protein (c-di-GMP phosphodiesterase class II)
VSVADSWEAMTSDRPYRQSLNRQQAMKEIKLNSRTQFDPKVVEIFFKCVEKKVI